MPDQRETLVRKMIAEGTSDDDIRATLAVFDKAHALPTRPVSAEDFTKPTAFQEATQQLKDFGIGVAKGVGSTASSIGEMAANAGLIPGQVGGGFEPSFRNPLFQRAEEATTATNTPQKIGKYGEQAAELAMPAIEGGKAALTLGKAAVTKLPGAAVEIASHVPVIGRPVRMLRMLSKLLPAEAEAATTNAGGRLVAGESPKIEQVAADALSELRQPELPARITTPPQAELPAGYTPRTTVPKPKAAAAPKAAPAKPTPDASIGKRNYFLKANAPAAPPREAPANVNISLEDLPASWRSRVGQPLIAPQGAAGRQIASDAAGVLGERGVSAADAMDAVAKNPTLAPAVRMQLQAALLKMLGVQ